MSTPSPTASADATARLDTWLAAHEGKELLRFITCGNVDDGKSTLIGRLLLETDSIPVDVLEAVARDSKVRGTRGEETDLAFLTDGLKAEREQGITIDVAYRTFSTDRRRFILADAPGHEQYTRNMATGASTAELAIILIDARYGVTTQTRRHTAITRLLGIRQTIVAINKMDLVGFSQARFDEVKAAFEAFAAKLPPSNVAFVPIVATDGDSVVMRGSRMPWYAGPSVLELLETLPVDAGTNHVDFRFPVQLALRPNESFRGLAGSVASGEVRVGDPILALPSGRTSRVARLTTLDRDLPSVRVPMATTIVLEDDIDCSRGDMLVRPDQRPALSTRFTANLVWMSDAPLVPGREYLIRHATLETPATIVRVVHRLDIESLETTPGPTLRLNEIGLVEVRTSRPIAIDPYERNRATGSFVVIDRISAGTLGGGMVVASDVGHWDDPAEAHLTPTASSVTLDERRARLGQRPATVVLMGLSGSGKSSVARAVERLLFERGNTAIVLDGAMVRTGLSRDLGFTAADRSENLRRSMELARLMNDAGLIVVGAFSAPQAETRDRCRELVGQDRFFLVHVDAPLEHCRSRDPSGLYRDAALGKVRDVPGLDAPFERPTNADLVVRSDQLSVAACAERVVALLRERCIVE
jgi:bifunctional enzyme CysN/CysC